MTAERLFLDTVFIQALLNRRDKFHQWAVALLPRLSAATEVWITEAILVEVGNALAAIDRAAVVAFCQQCYTTDNIRVVSVDADLMQLALHFYESRGDKTWGLTDCISFVVMQEAQLTLAATADHHFEQAGFRILYQD